MDRKNRDQTATHRVKTRRDGTHGTGKKGFSIPCVPEVQPDDPERDEFGAEFAHIPGFSYSVSGEGKAWMDYTQEKDAKGGCPPSRCAKSSRRDAAASPRAATRAPDGGWGWVIVIASMGISLVADGVSFSFGIIYIEFLRYFRESKSKTSVIGSLFMAVPLMSGPLASALVDRFGCRSMTILGGVISAAGFVASSRVDSIEVMCVTFGILSGLGLALCYVTAVVCVAFWFDQKRSLANGLGVCGTGVGTFLFAPLTQALIEAYGWRGTTLILAGAFLQMCVCGAVMREPDSRDGGEDTSAALRRIEEGAAAGGGRRRLLPGIVETTAFAFEKGSRAAGGDPEVSGTGRRVKEDATRSLGDLDLREAGDGALQPPADQSIPFASSSFRTLDLPGGKDSRGPSVSKGTRTGRGKGGGTESKETHQSPSHTRHQAESVPDIKISVAVKQVPSEPPREATNQAATASGSPKNALQQAPHQTSPMAHLQGLRFRRNSISCRGTLPIISKHDPRVSSCPDIYRIASPHSTKQKKERWYDNFLNLLMDAMDFSMFLEWHFMLLSFSTFLLFTFFIVPYFYLAEHVISLGYSESEASMLISIIGILNTVGMIALGWAGDQTWMNVTKTYALCLCLCGIFTGIMPLLTNSYPLLAISCALFGLFFASNFSFTPVIIVELISLDRFTMAYGLILLTQGLGNLLGPPLAGWLYDTTNTWNLSFYLAGFFIFISGLAIALITCSKNFIIGQRRAGKRNDCNQNNEEGISCKRSLLEAG